MTARRTNLAGKSGRAGIAALEFGLIVPLLIVMILGIADFSMVYHGQLQLSSALASGAQYAFARGQTETGTTLTTDVTGFVGSVSPIALSTVSATYNNGADSTQCFCISGSPATYASATCGAACADGSTAGKYVSITGAFTYSPMFLPATIFLGGTYAQTVTVRLQ